MKIIICSLACSLFLSPVFSSTGPVRDKNWLSQLHPAMQFYLFERNQSRTIRERDIPLLLPLRTIDLRMYDDVTDIEFLQDFPKVETLLLGPAVEVFSVLEVGNLNNLRSLDISFTRIDDNMICEFRLPGLEWINISGTGIRNLDFVNNFPVLSEIVILPNQMPEDYLSEFLSRYPDISVVLSEIVPLVNQDNLLFVLSEYLNYFAQTYGAFSSLPRMVNLQIDIGPEGNVRHASVLGSRSNSYHIIEIMLKRLQFPAEGGKEGRTIIIPIKKSG
jgi:hypothetical protein